MTGLFIEKRAHFIAIAKRSAGMCDDNVAGLHAFLYFCFMIRQKTDPHPMLFNHPLRTTCTLVPSVP